MRTWRRQFASTGVSCRVVPLDPLAKSHARAHKQKVRDVVVALGVGGLPSRIIRPEMVWHVRSRVRNRVVRHIVIQIATRARRPVPGMRSEEAGRGVGNGRVSVHEVELGAVVVSRVVRVVRRHEDVLLVLVRGGVACGRLHGLR